MDLCYLNWPSTILPNLYFYPLSNNIWWFLSHETKIMNSVIWKISNFQNCSNPNFKKLNRVMWGGATGLEIIIARYMPWLYGKTLCTCIMHNLIFFEFFLTNINAGIFMNIWEFFDWAPILWGFLLIKPLRCKRATFQVAH